MSGNVKRRVLFMGTPEYAEVILRRMLAEESLDVVAVITQPDRPVGRKQELTPPPVKRRALEAGVELLQPQRLDEATVERIRALGPDQIVVAAFGQILPPAVLEIAPCINLHASLLPDFRGASPIQAAVLRGDRVGGVTAMWMDEGLDTGAVLGYRLMDVTNARAADLFDAMAEGAAELTLEVLERFGRLRPLPQSSCDAGYVGKTKKCHGLVDFRDAGELDRKFRAYHPWPGVFLEGGVALRELEPAAIEGNHEPGTILEIEGEGAVVGCGRGSVRLLKIQAPSKKAVSAAEYLRGKRVRVGDPFPS